MRPTYCIMLAPLMAGACTTIDQAPLVYVSTVKIGIGASGGTPGSPGANILIGYDQTDAAYVPVQIARRCERKAAKECGQADYPILDVRGSNAIDPGELFQRAAALGKNADLARKSYDQAIAALRKATSEEHDAAGRERQHAEALAIVKGWDDHAEASPAQAADAAAGTTAPQETDAVQKARKTLVALAGAGKAASAATEARRKAEIDATAAGTKLEELQTALAALLAEKVRIADTKNDALSVYGSFSGNASTSVGADGPSAGLNLGKTFSTGVAAQELTLGIKDAAIKSANPQALCLANAASAVAKVTQAERAAILTDAIKVCQTIGS